MLHLGVRDSTCKPVPAILMPGCLKSFNGQPGVMNRRSNGI